MIQSFSPHPALRPYIGTFLVVAHAFDVRVDTVFSARGVPMLVFPFKTPADTSFRHGLSDTRYPHAVMDAPALLGPENEFAQVSFQGDINFIMVMLHPTGAYHLLRSNVKDRANSIETLAQLGLNRHFDVIQDKLWHTRKPAEAVALVQQGLLQYFAQQKISHTGDFSPVLNYMLRQPTGLTVGGLAKKFRCSERWIEKQCALQTGLSPKNWLRLIRYRAAANHWLSHDNITSMAMVARFGYTDQSHLIRDFHQFSGNTPLQHFIQNGETELGFLQHEAGLSGFIHPLE